MTPLRKSHGIFSSRRISTLLVAVVALAWLLASNHCALAALAGLKKPPHACCHEDSPGRQSQGAMQCCNTFHVTVPVHVGAPEAALHMLRPAWLETSAVPASGPVRGCENSLANAPPRALGFAETILNRSLLSHAPPHFAA